MSHWPAIFEGDGSPAFEGLTQTFVYFPDRGVERHGKGKMVGRKRTQVTLMLQAKDSIQHSSGTVYQKALI